VRSLSLPELLLVRQLRLRIYLVLGLARPLDLVDELAHDVDVAACGEAL
jgi:hypothetical protein